MRGGHFLILLISSLIDAVINLTTILIFNVLLRNRSLQGLQIQGVSPLLSASTSLSEALE